MISKGHGKVTYSYIYTPTFSVTSDFSFYLLYVDLKILFANN